VILRSTYLKAGPAGGRLRRPSSAAKEPLADEVSLDILIDATGFV